MQLSFTLCTLFSMLSKHLEFLSFHIAHHIEAEISLHLPLSFSSTHASSQLFKASKTFPGIVQEMPL